MRHDIPFDELVIQPYIADNVEEVDTWHMHPYGRVSVHWKKRDETHVCIQVELPANTRGTFIAPDGTETKIGSGSYEFTCEPK